MFISCESKTPTKKIVKNDGNFNNSNLKSNIKDELMNTSTDYERNYYDNLLIFSLQIFAWLLINSSHVSMINMVN
uniref:Uncharacterized protein n=1 Tax=Tetranychus urticae TaxID=32264 RepID=T1KLC8_TETUR